MKLSKIINNNFLVVTVAVLLMSACNSADNRLRTYFDIPTSTTLNETTIRDAVLLKIPLGTPEPVVRQKLNELGIAKDKLSGYYGPDKDRKAMIRIGFEPNSFEIVYRHYGVILTCDDKMKLHDVVVAIWLTGP